MQRTLRALCEPRHLRLWSSPQGLSRAEPPCSPGSPKLRCQRRAETKRRNRTRMSSLQENATTRNASLLWSLSQNGYGFPFFLHLPFVHLLFLDLLFLDLIFSFHHFSLSRYVTHLFCHWSHLSSFLPLKIIFLCSFRFSCRFCLVAFASFFVWTLFLLCSVVFSPPFLFFFLTEFLHFVFHVCVGSFLIRLFSCFPCVAPCFSLLVIISLFPSKMFVYACFVFVIFLLFRSLSTKYLVSFCLILIVTNIFKNRFLFLQTFDLIFGIPC